MSKQFTTDSHGLSVAEKSWTPENDHVPFYSWKVIYSGGKAAAITIQSGLDDKESLAEKTALFVSSKDMYKMLERFAKYFDEMCEGDVVDEINNLLAKARGEL